MLIRSQHARITTRTQAKSGFPDVVTLHGVVTDPDDPSMVGTEVVVDGVEDSDVETAKSYFLRYSGDFAIEATRYGEVIAMHAPDQPAAVYVKGLRVADEPNFLFSYTSLRSMPSCLAPPSRPTRRRSGCGFTRPFWSPLRRTRCSLPAGPPSRRAGRACTGWPPAPACRTRARSGRR